MVHDVTSRGLPCRFIPGNGPDQLVAWYGSRYVGAPVRRPGAPDVFMLVPSMQQALLTGTDMLAANDAADFTALARGLNVEMEMFDRRALDACRLFGRLSTTPILAGLPLVSNPLVLSFNREVLAAARIVPDVWSIDGFVSQCEAIHGRVRGLVAPLGGVLSDGVMATIIGAYGGRLADPYTGEVFITDSSVIDGIEALLRIKAWTSDYRRLVPSLEAGEVAFEFRWLSDAVVAMARNKVIDILPVPFAVRKATAMTVLGLAVAKTATDPLAAARFVVLATSVPAVSRVWLAGGLGLPARQGEQGALQVVLPRRPGLQKVVDMHQEGLALQEFYGGVFRQPVVAGLSEFILETRVDPFDRGSLRQELTRVQANVEALVAGIKASVEQMTKSGMGASG
jgi:ABC-type glycerol-3-phosphate transport system substrate-binding protein